MFSVKACQILCIFIVLAIVPSFAQEVPVSSGDLSGSTHPSTQKVSYSSEDLAACIQAATAQASEMSLKYRITVPDFSLPSLKPDGAVQFDVSQKWSVPTKRRAYDFKTTPLDEKGQKREKSLSLFERVTDGIVAFDGESTIVFDRVKQPGKPLIARILPGLQRSYVPSVPSAYEMAFGWIGETYWRDVLSAEGAHFEVADENASVNGLRTIELRGKAYQRDFRLWICPDRNFLVVKSWWKYSGEIPEEITRTTDKITRVGNVWFPYVIRDEYMLHGYSVVCEVSSATVSSFSIDDFRPPLPPGTYVSDQVSNIAYTTAVATTGPSDGPSPNKIAQDQLDDYLHHATTQTGSTP